MHTIQVERRTRYGRPAFVPANTHAQRIAEIAGTTEVRPKDLDLARQLGFRVVVVARLSNGKTFVEVEELS